MCCFVFRFECSSASVCSVKTLTAANPEGLNAAKAYFDVASNKPDADHLDAASVRAMVQSGQLSPYTEKAIEDVIEQEQPGVVSFGEIAPFLRGGEQGVLSESETELVRQSLEPMPRKSEVEEDTASSVVYAAVDVRDEKVEEEAEKVEEEAQPEPAETPRPVFDAPLTDRPVDLGEHTVQPKAPVMMSRAARELDDEDHTSILHDTWSKVPEEETLDQLRKAFNRHADNSDGSEVSRVPWSKLDDLVRDFGFSVGPAYVAPDDVLAAANTLSMQPPSTDKERVDFEGCVAALTKLPPANLNDTKAFFEQVPNKPDADHLSRQQVQDVVALGCLQPLSVEIIEKRVGRKQEGRVTFGELVPLVRMGPDCELADDEATTLRKEILHPTDFVDAPFSELVSDVPTAVLLDELHKAFRSADVEEAGVIPWDSLKVVARNVGKQTKIDGRAVRNALARFPTKPPSAAESELEFEEW